MNVMMHFDLLDFGADVVALCMIVTIATIVGFEWGAHATKARIGVTAHSGAVAKS